MPLVSEYIPVPGVTTLSRAKLATTSLCSGLSGGISVVRCCKPLLPKKTSHASWAQFYTGGLLSLLAVVLPHVAMVLSKQHHYVIKTIPISVKYIDRKEASAAHSNTK